MSEMCEVFINQKTGQVDKNDIGESDLANQFITRFSNEGTCVGFYCENGKESEMFERLKNKEIKRKKQEIKQLQKQIKMFENAQLD
jgi:hypothetical protein